MDAHHLECVTLRCSVDLDFPNMPVQMFLRVAKLFNEIDVGVRGRSERRQFRSWDLWKSLGRFERDPA